MGWPERTFKGRERVSLLPRWLANWSATLTVLYFMWSYIGPLMGFENQSFDPWRKNDPTPTVDAYGGVVPDQPIGGSVDYSSSVGNLPATGQGPVTEIQEVNAVATPIITATLEFTPTPTSTPFPTAVPYSAYIPVGKLVAVGYSYYWPPWGPPNCSKENWHERENYCDDITASGLPWSQYVERAVAIPYEWKDIIPLQSVIRIHSPEIMRGDYLVIDYCGDCIKKEGHIYFDFLSARQILAWTVPMMAEVIPP